MLRLEKPWDRQPQEPTAINQSGIGRGIFASIDRDYAYVNGLLVPATDYGGTGLPPLAAGAAGIGNNTTGALVDRRILVDGPLAATAPWTFAVTLSATANVSLSHLFGFGLLYNGTTFNTSSTIGTYRSVLNFNSNYYFWGSSADWDTTIAFDTDSVVRTIVFSHDGTNIYFYRSGVLRGSTARPGAMIATPAGRYSVLGNKHASGTNSPSANIYKARAWGRCLAASEVAEYSANPDCVYAPQTIWVPVSVGGGSATDLTIQDATHAHTADGVTVTLDTTLAVQDATHAHTADSLTLTLDTTLAIDEALHAHTADNLTLSVSGATNLVIADALHAHTADSLVISLGYVDLVIQDATHAHTADNITLSGLYSDLELILKILSNRQELNAGTGTFTVYDDDSVSVLFTANAWADAAGTVPYSGGTLARIDRLV